MISGDKSSENCLLGVDSEVTSESGSYMLSYGQNGLCFYKMSDGMKLAPHKAYISITPEP
ncbi:MAG: hypothetical protein MJY44_06320 [Bacteroidales bacterium]|nr:hypothetical protein [Bacteroidales bacterium]